MVERSFIFVSPERFFERWDPGFYLDNSNDYNDTGKDRVNLGDLVSVQRRNLSKRPYPYFKYIEISSIDTKLGEITGNLVKEYKFEEIPTRARYWARSYDLVTALVRPERGSSAIIPKEYDGCAVSSALAVLTTKNVKPEYLHFLLRSKKMRSLMGQKAKGNVIPTIGIKELLNLPVPVYRSREVDDLLDELKYIKDELKVSISKIKDIPKFIEDTVLSVLPSFYIKRKTAFVLDYSKLNAERFDVAYYALDNQCINEALLKTGHPVVLLGELILDIEIGMNLKIEDEGIPVIRNVNIQADGTIDDSRVYVQDISRISRVKPDSILLSLSGSNVGAVAVVSEIITGLAYNQSIVCLQLKHNINPWYFALFMNSSYGKKQVERLQSISGRPYLTLSSLREIQLPLLPLEEQNMVGDKAKNLITSRKERYAYWLEKYEGLEKKLWEEL